MLRNSLALVEILKCQFKLPVIPGIIIGVLPDGEAEVGLESFEVGFVREDLATQALDIDP